MAAVAVLVALVASACSGGEGPGPGSQAREDGAVMVGAGDIAECMGYADNRTAKLLDGIPGTVFTVGDNAYPSGKAWQFGLCYGASWGRHKARTRPAPGNHDYLTPGASGYFDYFGTNAGPPGRGYYSYERGGWHVVSLDSNACGQAGGCGAASPMVSWLRRDLAANPTKCTLAYFHHPLFSSGSEHGDQPQVRPIWEVLYAAEADVVVGAHDHDYERFAPQRPDGTRDAARGIRQFVVGTGGPTDDWFGETVHGFGEAAPNSEAREAGSSGVLKLTLKPGSYTWEFVSVRGAAYTDSGRGRCH